jgi:hypothetical protein
MREVPQKMQMFNLIHDFSIIFQQTGNFSSKSIFNCWFALIMRHAHLHLLVKSSEITIIEIWLSMIACYYDMGNSVDTACGSLGILNFPHGTDFNKDQILLGQTVLTSWAVNRFLNCYVNCNSSENALSASLACTFIFFLVQDAVTFIKHVYEKMIATEL